MYRIIKTISTIILISVIIPLSGQSLRIEQVISDTPVFCITMDHHHVLWLGTESGLLSYNSKTINEYRYDPRDSLSLTDNSVRSLLIDSRDQLWVGTRNGLNRYRRDHDDFQRYHPDPLSDEHLHGGFITSIAEDTDGFIWVGTESAGLHRLNPISGAIVHLKADESYNTVISNDIEKIRIEGNGDLWVASRSGLNYRDRNTNQWHHYYAASASWSSLPDNDLIGLEVDQQGKVWMSSRNKKLIILNTNDEVRFWDVPWKITTISNDPRGNIYLGTGEGRIMKVPGSSLSWDKAETIFHDQSQIGVVRAIYVDKWGNLWIGSENGLFVHYNKERQFDNISGNTTGLPLSSVIAMLYDNEDKLWLSSGNELAVKQQNNTGRFMPAKAYSHPNVPSVYSFFQDSYGFIWLGTNEMGLYRYNPADHTLVRYLHDPDDQYSIGYNSIWAIVEDDEHNLWLGSWGGGLIYHNRKTDTFKTFNAEPTQKNALNHPKIISLLYDRDGLLWIGTDGGGLNSYDPRTNTFRRHKILIHDKHIALDRSIISMHEDRQGRIWIGSDGGGLIIHDKNDNSFRVYDERHGLKNQSVKAILEDDSGKIWVSTNGGGIFLYMAGQERFIQFTTIDGLSTNRFHNNCAVIDREGNLYFGGFNGFTRFNPANIQTTDYNPFILLTAININNEDRTFGPDGLLKPLIETGELRLKPSSRLISLEFAAVEYAISDKNTYRYRLKGFNDSWLDIGNNPTLSFMNLPPGKYGLELQTTNSDGLWSENIMSFQLVVLPPFYKTSIFLASLAALLSLLLYVLYRYNMRGIKRRQLLLEEKVAQRTEKIRRQSLTLEQQNRALIKQKQELTNRNRKIIKSRERVRFMTKKVHEADQMKLRFFTNISHELRTPLTLIIGPLEHLIERFMNSKDNTLDQLLTMRQNAGRILKLFDQIITFRKAESGSLRLYTTLGNISLFIDNILDTFRDYASHKNIQIRFTSDPEKIFMHFDEEKIEKIISNLIANAIKFTGTGGVVSVCIKEMEKNDPGNNPKAYPEGAVLITVRDNGIGIPKNELSNIFNRFHQVRQRDRRATENGVGIGLSLVKSLVGIHFGDICVESKPGKGSAFFVRLPKGNTHLSERQIRKGTSQNQQLSLTPESHNKRIILDKPVAEDIIEDSQKNPCDKKKRHTVVLVEDNHDLKSFLSKWLQDHYFILTAENGRQGLEIIKKEHPDIVISDVIMPEMDGLELLKELKADMETCHIPVIMLTAKADFSDRIEGLKLFADAYITKPFHLEHLLAVVSGLLENRKLVQKRYRNVFFMQPEEVEVSSPDEVFLKKAKTIIEQNISNPDFDVNQLSREIGVSRAGVYRKMKALTNMSVSILVRKMRMKRAAQILSQNKIYVSEVAYMVGFNDVQYFRKCFLKTYKMPPSQYAEKHADKA